MDTTKFCVNNSDNHEASLFFIYILKEILGMEFKEKK